MRIISTAMKSSLSRVPGIHKLFPVGQIENSTRIVHLIWTNVLSVAHVIDLYRAFATGVRGA